MSRSDKQPRWLRRACAASLALHVALALALRWRIARVEDDGELAAVDVELAPEAPRAAVLPEEKPVPVAAATAPAPPPDEPPPAPPPPEPGDTAIDAGAPDARAHADARPRPDARVDAGLDAAPDADEAIARAGDAGAPLDDAGGAVAIDQATAGSDGGAADGDGGPVVAAAPARDGGAPTGDAAAELAAAEAPAGGSATGTGSGTGAGPGGAPGGDDGGEDNPDVVGASTAAATPGTASNLLSYFPAGHVVTLLLRFDRLRGTEWAAATEKLLAPMPDYQTLIGDRPVHVADVFDTLVISTPNPRDVNATTLVGKSAVAPSDLRALLDHDGAPVTWSAAVGGALGRRGAGTRVFPGDRRVFLAPFAGWIVLAQPADLGTLTRAGRGALDSIAAPDKALPDWLRRVRTIESEAGTPTGPALVLTMSALAGRYELPDIGVGVTSLPAPDRITLALQVDKHGFVVVGNLRFASDADAIEMAQGLTAIHDRVMDSRLLQAMMRKTRALNLIQRLTVARTGKRVSYATALSIADARALLEVAAQMVGDYYAAQRAH